MQFILHPLLHASESAAAAASAALVVRDGEHDGRQPDMVQAISRAMGAKRLVDGERVYAVLRGG